MKKFRKRPQAIPHLKFVSENKDKSTTGCETGSGLDGQPCKSYFPNNRFAAVDVKILQHKSALIGNFDEALPDDPAKYRRRDSKFCHAIQIALYRIPPAIA